MTTLTVTIEEKENADQFGLTIEMNSRGKDSTPLEQAFAKAAAKTVTLVAQGLTQNVSKLNPDCKPSYFQRANIDL